MHDGYDTHVELDGRLGHDRAVERWRDMARDNASTLTGRRVLRFDWWAVFGAPCALADQVGAVLRLGGWAGQVRHSTSCAGRCGL